MRRNMGCLVDALYNFQAVPTDVEQGPHGRLYVTTLPGVVAVKYANGHLCASTSPAASDAHGSGTVVLPGR